MLLKVQRATARGKEMIKILGYVKLVSVTVMMISIIIRRGILLLSHEKFRCFWKLSFMNLFLCC